MYPQRSWIWDTESVAKETRSLVFHNRDTEKNNYANKAADMKGSEETEKQRSEETHREFIQYEDVLTHLTQ